MRLSSTKTKNAESFYAIQTVTKNGKQTTKVVEKLGTLEGIKTKIGKDKDPYEWAREYVQELNRKEKEETREVITKYSPLNVSGMRKWRRNDGKKWRRTADKKCNEIIMQ